MTELQPILLKLTYTFHFQIAKTSLLHLNKEIVVFIKDRFHGSHTLYDIVQLTLFVRRQLIVDALFI